MRVIAGLAKGHTLRGPKSDATRPTSDKVRGAIFSMLEAMMPLEGLRALDLYAGTGALGIEALSRGAAWCDFVEQDRAACRIIAENLDHTRLAGQAKVHALAVEKVLAHPEFLTPHFTESPGYDIITLDPPYADEGIWAVMERLADWPLTATGAVVVLEHSKRTEPPVAIGDLAMLKTRRHGDTSFTLYRHVVPRVPAMATA
jgi:16S rRNA (guanine966-N2)-methyltransferase